MTEPHAERSFRAQSKLSNRSVEPIERSSEDIVSEHLAWFRDRFPEVLTGDGKVDPERLLATLGEVIDVDKERYTFTWAGKKEAIRVLQLPSRATLLPVEADSESFDTTSNVFIEGDNLEVLKLLHRSYFGRVKMIYLDPPYNTGNDLIYFDDFSDPLDAYLKYTGQTDEEGNLLTTNPETNGRFHSTWLSMMYPRLFLARQLLRDDGVLFISCNDIEQAHLRLILNEVFGEENFVATLIWNNEGNIDNQSKVKTNHEYILMYARSVEHFERPTVIDPNIDETSKLFNDEIENTITKNGPANPVSEVVLPKGFPAAFESGVVAKRDEAWPHLLEDIKVEDSVLAAPARLESGWSSKNILQLFIDNGFQPIQDGQGRETRFALTSTGAIYRYSQRSADQGHVLTVIRNVGTTQQSSAMLAKWGLKFDWPKPVRLIEYLCQIATKDRDIVLDFFSGSGTTAHAVLAANHRDGGSRRFITVQLPEALDEPAAAKSGRSLATIADQGAERIRCAAKEIASTPVDVGVTSPSDYGFRLFKLGSSLLKPWKGLAEHDAAAYAEQMEWFADGLVVDWTPDNLMWEVAIKEGFSLSSVVSSAESATNQVWWILDEDKGQSLIICLDDVLNAATVRDLGISTDDLFVCRDTALDDELAANLALQCRLKTI